MQFDLTHSHKVTKVSAVITRQAIQTAAFLLSLLLPMANLSAWDIVKVDKRDFVRIEEVASFYQMGRPVSFGNNGLRLAGANGAIVFNVGSRESTINGIKHWLCFPVMESRGEALLSRTDLSKTIEPLMRPDRIVPRRLVETVIIDPGHGGDDHGARGRWTRDEKDLVLDSARFLRDELRRDNVRTVMTRTWDNFIPLAERARETQKHRNAIFVSLHFNHGGTNATGTEVFAVAPRGAPATMQSRPSNNDFVRLSGHAFDAHSILLADAIERRIAPLHGRENSRGVKRARFHVLRDSWCPAVLVEGGFLSSRADSNRINQRDFTKKFAQSVRQGIKDYMDALEGRRSYMVSTH